MYGRDFLDWTDKESASSTIDAFLACMPAHERKWVLSVLRDRFEVRVEYRDSPLDRLSQAAGRGLQDAIARQTVCGRQHYTPSLGGAFGSLLGG